jgi:hypothetical protein
MGHAYPGMPEVNKSQNPHLPLPRNGTESANRAMLLPFLNKNIYSRYEKRLEMNGINYSLHFQNKDRVWTLSTSFRIRYILNHA